MFKLYYGMDKLLHPLFGVDTHQFPKLWFNLTTVNVRPWMSFHLTVLRGCNQSPMPDPDVGLANLL